MSTTSKTLISVLVIIILLGGGYFAWQKYTNTKNATPYALPSAKKSASSVGLSIPKEILANKFGFLGYGEDQQFDEIKKYGALWVGPHPGPFLWDMMQPILCIDEEEPSGCAPDQNFNFEQTDKIVENAQNFEIGLLVTLWPFAEWDQKARTDAENCKVSVNDEFLPKNDKKGRGDYLPEHRCNPNDWDSYQKWIKAVVERYDGDGISDMNGLKIPIKYWEVMNEPDLNYQQDAGSPDRLTFYKQGPNEYAELLTKTSIAIRQADTKAQILIAGAAGGKDNFLNFYREVFKNKEALTAFDIGNVHCISNDTDNDFNVGAYKKVLEEFNLDKPIWVTEAEDMELEEGTRGAISAGAERIFYTRYTLSRDMGEKYIPTEQDIKESQEIYRKIIEKY